MTAAPPRNRCSNRGGKFAGGRGSAAPRNSAGRGTARGRGVVATPRPWPRRDIARGRVLAATPRPWPRRDTARGRGVAATPPASADAPRHRPRPRPRQGTARGSPRKCPRPRRLRDPVVELSARGRGVVAIPSSSELLAAAASSRFRRRASRPRPRRRRDPSSSEPPAPAASPRIRPRPRRRRREPGPEARPQVPRRAAAAGRRDAARQRAAPRAPRHRVLRVARSRRSELLGLALFCQFHRRPPREKTARRGFGGSCGGREWPPNYAWA